MKFIHTADWHLGKIVQGVHMTDDQRYLLEQFIEAVEEEKPDAVIIAGDLYDRAVPPTEAVKLLDDVLGALVLDKKIPVLAIAGNHDSPSRLHFGSELMKKNGYFISGHLSKDVEPVILKDEYGEVHFHLIPYADPSIVRVLFEDDSITTHDQAMKRVVDHIAASMNPECRHVFVGHAFVTPGAREEENTSASERPLSIGGAEYVNADHFAPFHYTALGHLHQAHYVGHETIRYAGSPMKYSISEEHHNKGFFVVTLDEKGHASIEKRNLIPRRDLRSVEGTLEEILRHEPNEDYVYVRLLDQTPVLFPMEKVRTVYPNALHVERKLSLARPDKNEDRGSVSEMDDVAMFHSFYEEITGEKADEETMAIFSDVLQDLTVEERDPVKGGVRP